MKKILLVCAMGMSTSILMSKMDKAAEAKGIEAKIWAIGNQEVDEQWEEADIILLGPQIGYMQKKIEKIVDGAIPVKVIDNYDYAIANGEAVLEKAIKLLDNK